MTVAAGPAKSMGYTAAMRAMHWVSASLLIGSYVTAWSIEGAPSGEDAARFLMLHRSFGLIIFTITALRLVWRQRTRIPDLPPDVPGLQRLAARANVIGLYILLFVQPLLGITASMLHGDRIRLLGGFLLPGFLPVDRKLAHLVFQVHGAVALVLLGLIGLHAAAALYHHFIRQDDVLAGMVPGLRRRERAISPAATAPR